MKKIAIITARGGSKRIHKKNIKPFFGKPIIAYSIEAALQSGVFDEVMVSTDDEEIAAIAREYGAAVPFMRSEATSNDTSNTVDVLEEVLLQYRSAGSEFDLACCLYPTAPFVTADRLKQAFTLLEKSKADTVLPITAFSFPILKSFKMDEQSRVSFNWDEYQGFHSQQLPSSYHDSGQFYCFQVAGFLQHKKLFTDNTVGLEIPETEVQDINTEDDWRMAEIKFGYLHPELS
jgi:N-acylneuraminate cytidylyltransferase